MPKKTYKIVIEFDDGTDTVKLVEAIDLKYALYLAKFWAQKATSNGKQWAEIYELGGVK